MLIDLSFEQQLIDECNARMEKLYPKDYQELIVVHPLDRCERIQEGVYVSYGIDLRHEIKLFSHFQIKEDFHSFSTIRPHKDGGFDAAYFHECCEKGLEHRDNYGVCDNADQIFEKYPELFVNDRKFVVSLIRIVKDHQCAKGGWRWEKSGEYIGNRNSQAGYLYDEPDISEVFCYHILELH